MKRIILIVHTQQSLFINCLKFQIWLHLDFLGMEEKSIFLIHYKTILIFYKEKHFLFLKKCIFFASKNRSWSLINRQSIKILVALVKGLPIWEETLNFFEKALERFCYLWVLFECINILYSLFDIVNLYFTQYSWTENRDYCQAILILGIILCVVRYFSFYFSTFLLFALEIFFMPIIFLKLKWKCYLKALFGP